MPNASTAASRWAAGKRRMILFTSIKDAFPTAPFQLRASRAIHSASTRRAGRRHARGRGRTVEAPKKGGKRAVSTTRKASAKVAKAKKSVAAKKHEEQEAQAAADEQDDVEPADAEPSAKEEAAAEEKDDEMVASTKKGGRKTRSVSTKKLAAKAQVEEDEPEKDEPAEEAEVEPAAEEPAKTLSTKKSATGLGNGIASQSTAARPTRAASRRATKAINLLSTKVSTASSGGRTRKISKSANWHSPIRFLSRAPRAKIPQHPRPILSSPSSPRRADPSPRSSIRS